MFSTIIVHNCGPHPVILNSSTSFPAPAYCLNDESTPLPASWAPKDTSTYTGRLELSLVKRISEGRVGVVYSAAVVSATKGGVDTSTSLPPTICVKIAKKHHCRSAAREAWFYEQLAGIQGIAIPQCYGFYATKARDQKQPDSFPRDFVPWKDLRRPSSCDPSVTEWSPSLDWLHDDLPDCSDEFFDNGGLKQKSPWCNWNVDEANPDVAVLLLEMLGDPCARTWNCGESRQDLRKEILLVLEDVTGAGVEHNDISAWNILRFDGEETLERRCPRHGVVHRWRFIDFERSHMVYMGKIDICGTSALSRNEFYVGYGGSFWGHAE